MTGIKLRLARTRIDSGTRDQYVPGYYRATPRPIRKSEMANGQIDMSELINDILKKTDQDNT